MPKKNGFAPILILIILLAAIAGIYVISKSQTKSPQPSPAPVSATDPITNWKTFKNAGFSFQYPKNYNFADPVIVYNFEVTNRNELTNYSTLAKNRIILRFDRGYGPDQNKNLSNEEQQSYTEEWATNYFDSYTVKEKGEITISGVRSWKAILCPSGDSESLNKNFSCTYEIIVPYGKDSINIQAIGDLSLQVEIDQILSTFHFLK